MSNRGQSNNITGVITGIVLIMLILGVIGFISSLTNGFSTSLATFYVEYNGKKITSETNLLFPAEDDVKIDVKYLLEFAESDTTYTVEVKPNLKKNFKFKAGGTTYNFVDIDSETLTSAFKITYDKEFFTIDLSDKRTVKDVLDELFIVNVSVDDLFLNDYYFTMLIKSSRGDEVKINFGIDVAKMNIEKINLNTAGWVF